MGTSQRGTINGSQVIRTQSGSATGEVIYTTASGARWTSEVKPWDHTTTGVVVSQIQR